MLIEDSYLHKGLRKKLVEEIKNKGIKDQKVLDAINKVQRHLFMDSSFVKFAYKDQAFPISEGQTISQPFTVAVQSELLEIEPRNKVLEVGTGSGYQAAILAELGAKVYTIERHKNLMVKAKNLLTRLGYKINFFYGDGHKGLPTYGPYDRIIITAAAKEIPEQLLKQLKIGGKLVIPQGGTHSQKMKLLIKTGDDSYKISEHGSFIFVPMLKGKS